MQRLKQLFVPLSILAAVASAVGLYAIKLETRVVAAGVARLEAAIAKQESGMVVLKAELANRARPDRIAKLARKHLGMKPLSPAQLDQFDKLPWREGVVAEGRQTTTSP